jgi:hypothetical protein
VKLGGTIDSYYGLNLDHGQGFTVPTRAFDGVPGLRLAYAKITGAVEFGPAALRVDLGFAPTATSVTNFFVQQAYATYRFGPVVAIDFGRFVTIAGAEVIEAKDNWLYSRSLLFTFAIPFAHTGARAVLTFPDGVTIQAGVVNGWDDDALGTAGVADLNGHGWVTGPQKTGMFQLAWAKGPHIASVNVYSGYPAPSEPGQNPQDVRTLVDVVLGTAAGPLALNLNGDYGSEASRNWYGVAAMARYAFPHEVFHLSARGEWFDDPKGFRTASLLSPIGATSANYYEGTVSGSYAAGSNAELRVEVRVDGSNRDVFEGTKTASTFQVAALAWF